MMYSVLYNGTTWKVNLLDVWGVSHSEFVFETLASCYAFLNALRDATITSSVLRRE